MRIAFAIAASVVLAGLTLGELAFAAPPRPAITAVSHLAVYSADMAKSQAFYVNQLGAVKGADPEDANGVRYYFNPRQFVEVLPLPAIAAPKNRMAHAAFVTAHSEALRQ